MTPASESHMFTGSTGDPPGGRLADRKSGTTDDTVG